ncbi:hypothetical protein AB0P21_27040 [Kribbella sp. NPDC056861]|uniref:hypothetical protein n=1 Tax=Kribbella sp. NPDC056861 TaxID=3154857 RepID=UPI00341BA071
MTDPMPAKQEEPAAEKYKHLPAAVRLEDTIATHDPDAPADPTLGRDPETEFLLRHGGG